MESELTHIKGVKDIGRDYHLGKVYGRFRRELASRVVGRYGPRLSASEHDALLDEFFSGEAEQ